jgi:hypothetical protein
MGSLRRECLDYMLILSEQHLRRIVKEYITYFNQARPVGWKYYIHAKKWARSPGDHRREALSPATPFGGSSQTRLLLDQECFLRVDQFSNPMAASKRH